MVSVIPEYSLSEEQQAAVGSDDRAIVVVASAGSGKTEVVARRVERLLAESPEESFRVLALSYTVKAADELRDRFRERLGQLHRRVDTETVHGFAHSLLRQHGTRIGLPVEPEVLTRDEDRAELLGRWLTAEGRPVPDDLPTVLGQLDLARARLEPAALLAEWDSALSAVGALDFAAMLERAAELLRLRSARRQLFRLYGHVIIDEAQNLTPSQYELLTALIGDPAEDGEHLPAMVVGDDKQSIVSFAGADPKLILRFESEYGATRFELTQNFRSAAAIAAVGESVAQRLTQPPPKRLSTSYAAPGLLSTHEATNESDEAAFLARWIVDLLREGLPSGALAPGESTVVRADDIAVLARSAAALRRTREALEDAGIPVAVASSPEDWLATVAGQVIVELIALRSASDHRSTHWHLSRLLETDEADVSDTSRLRQALLASTDESLRSIAPLCAAEDPPSLISSLSGIELPTNADPLLLAAWDADCELLMDAWRTFVAQAHAAEQTWANFRLHISRVQRGQIGGAGVRLMTIHKAQGREFPVVVIIGLNDGQLPDFRAKDPEEQLAELRAFYVAVTRASRVLMVTRPGSRETRYGPRAADASPYWQFLRAG